MDLFYTPQIVTAFVCTDNITLSYCTRWIRPEGPRHVEKTSRGWSCAVAERAHGKEHGDAHERPKIYVLKYTECHPPVYRLIHPTFRNCLEGETSSAKRKNPWVGSRPAYRAPDGVQGESPWQGSKAAPPCVGKFVFGEVECIISGP